MSSRVVVRGVLLSVAMAALASAQQFPFQMVATQAGTSITVQNGGTLAVTTAVGQTKTVRVTAAYTGSGQVKVSRSPVIYGSAAFTATLVGSLPLTINPGGSLSLDIEFSPTSAVQSGAQLSLPVPETTSTTTQWTLSLALQGTVPSFSLGYVLPADQNLIPLQPGGTILFPPSPIGNSVQAGLTIANIGSGAGTITGISITGDAFRLSGIPLFPATLSSGLALQVSVLYFPVSVGADSGQISITFSDSPSIAIDLQGSGVLSNFTYRILQPDPPASVDPGGTVTFADTNIGETSSITVQVTNSGAASSTVSAIAVSGQGFQLDNVPVIPKTLAPDSSLTFSVTFSPSVATTTAAV